MNSLPSLFISHGAPDLPIREGPTQDFLRQLPQGFPTPKAILLVSAHWLTARPTISKVHQPPTVYDFGGFPPKLYQLKYPAPGATALADQTYTLLAEAGFSPQVNTSRGFDHGAWMPLILIYPEANIPVTQLSIQPRQDPEYHFHLGQVLATLRQEGVLILSSGAATHNLQAFSPNYQDTPPHWVTVFDDWLSKTIHSRDWSSLFNYRQVAPYALENHPTDEHLLPLFVALGAGSGISPQDEIPIQQLHKGFTYGVFSMAAYAFGAAIKITTLRLHLSAVIEHDPLMRR